MKVKHWYLARSEGAIKSIDELRYLWRFKDPVKWVSKEGFEHED